MQFFIGHPCLLPSSSLCRSTARRASCFQFPLLGQWILVLSSYASHSTDGILLGRWRCRKFTADAFTGPILKPHHYILRLRWSQILQNLTRTEWSKVLFTDEWKSFFPAGGRTHVWRKNGTRFLENSVIKHVRWPALSVRIWVRTNAKKRTKLIFLTETLNSTCNIHQILWRRVVPFFRRHHRHVKFLDQVNFSHAKTL